MRVARRPCARPPDAAAHCAGANPTLIQTPSIELSAARRALPAAGPAALERRGCSSLAVSSLRASLRSARHRAESARRAAASSAPRQLRRQPGSGWPQIQHGGHLDAVGQARRGGRVALRIGRQHDDAACGQRPRGDRAVAARRSPASRRADRCCETRRAARTRPARRPRCARALSPCIRARRAQPSDRRNSPRRRARSETPDARRCARTHAISAAVLARTLRVPSERVADRCRPPTGFSSTSSTAAPRSAAASAAARPDGPAPITSTSQKS